MADSRKLPPIWLMGFSNATFGFYGGFAVVTLPSMLAAQGLSGGRIAAITSLTISPSFMVFLLGPMLDVRLSRRTYALLFSLLAAAGAFFTLLEHTNLVVVEWVTFLGYLAASLSQSAVGGWMGSLIRKDQDSALGAWFTVANIGAGGVMMLVAAQAVSRLPPYAGGCVVAAMLLLPTLTYLAVPAPGPDRKLARESYSQFFREVVSLVKLRTVQRALLLFLLPSASFALTNVLGGVGPEYGADERLVGLLAGVGSGIAGIAGSLVLQPLARKLPLRPLYLAIGIAGALFTLSLLLLPHASWAFAIAISGENLFQALAIATATAITFETIGPGHPLAATLFSLLVSASCFSIIYMGFIDARAYAWHGIVGSFAADAGLSGAVCVALYWALFRHRRPGAGLEAES
jgi:PAT family beta-lactamase induction signal transducer AmpG